jgi:hypothetical protein
MEGVASHVSVATLALLSYKMLFCSNRELSFTAMLFCCACAWCVGQLFAVVMGQNTGIDVGSFNVLGFPANIFSLVRHACNNSFLSETARVSCCKYTTWFTDTDVCLEK